MTQVGLKATTRRSLMNKLFSFTAGAICGALVGATVVLLLTPASGQELLEAARYRWDDAIAEGLRAREARERELRARFESMTRPG
jgi:gas vesicle protein